eukprot:15443-Eustigmatos_ZCMA.PRE.1
MFSFHRAIARATMCAPWTSVVRMDWPLTLWRSREETQLTREVPVVLFGEREIDGDRASARQSTTRAHD